MDGLLFTGWATGRKDNMSKQEMRHQARKLRLGWGLLQLQRMGSSGTPQSRSYVVWKADDFFIFRASAFTDLKLTRLYNCFCPFRLFCFVLLSDELGCSRLLYLNMFSLVARPSILLHHCFHQAHPFFHRLSAYGNFFSAF